MSMHLLCGSLVLAISVTLPAPARADDLATLVASARAGNLELREHAALVAQADAQTRVERSARYPSLTVRAGYTHHDHDVRVRLDDGLIDASLVPLDQLHAEVVLEVPIIDVSTWSRIESAEANADALRAADAGIANDVERAVVIAYYRWVAGTALVGAAQLAEQTALDTVDIVAGLLAAGVASELDVARARADVARARQHLADDQLIVARARRELRTLTGTVPDGVAPALPDDTSAEAPLPDWLGEVDALSPVRTATSAHRAAQVAADAAERSWLPTVAAFATARVGNAEDLAGARAAWAVGVTATWQLDLRTFRAARVADAGERVGAVRLARSKQDAIDRITDAWDVAEARRAGADAAEVVARTAQEALAVAQSRIVGGLATPLDLLGSQRDAFAAEVALVQARADLAAARALLRLTAGRAL